MLVYDWNEAPKRYLLVNEDNDECGTDYTMLPEEADECNRKLRAQMSPWRWFPWTEGGDA